MTTAAHTPGPWFEDDGFIHAAALPTCFDYVAWTGPYSGNESGDALSQMQANANLIAAAPCLLDALAKLLPMFAEWHSEFPQHVGDNEAPALQLARTAIAKATGAAS